MLQVFHLDVAYIASVSVVCCNVSYVSQICCEYFICMLRIFCNGFRVFSGVFASVLTHVSSVSSIFFYVVRVVCRYFKSRSGCYICVHDVEGTSGMRRN
jgi:hypothetical protein